MKQPNPTGRYKPTLRWLGGSKELVDPIIKKSMNKKIPNCSPGQIVTSTDGLTQYRVGDAGNLIKL